jgi:hypothetical protein
MKLQWTPKKTQKMNSQDEVMARAALLGELSEDVLSQISGGLSTKGACHTGTMGGGGYV